MVAAFAKATDAVATRCMRSAFAGLGIRVRMALHAGETDLRDEGNYFGPTIIRCARLRANGHGGQVVVDERDSRVVTASFLTAFQDNGPIPHMNVDG